MIDKNTDLQNTTAPAITYSECYALYFHSGHWLNLLIPKKKGKGFLKKPLGGHHANKNTMDLVYSDDLTGVVNFYHTTDVDNYLSLKMCKADYQQGFDSDLSIVLEKVKETWNQIKGFELVEQHVFWDAVP